MILDNKSLGIVFESSYLCFRFFKSEVVFSYRGKRCVSFVSRLGLWGSRMGGSLVI